MVKKKGWQKERKIGNCLLKEVRLYKILFVIKSHNGTLFIHSWSIHPFIQPSCISSFIRSFVRSFVHSFIHLLTRWLVQIIKLTAFNWLARPWAFHADVWNVTHNHQSRGCPLLLARYGWQNIGEQTRKPYPVQSESPALSVIAYYPKGTKKRNTHFFFNKIK